MKRPIIVVSLGGSMVVPKTGIDTTYLKQFHALISDEVKKGTRFVIVVGGGHTAREYQKAANSIVTLAPEDVDWLGIHATRLNGHLLRALFRDIALHRVVKDPSKNIQWRDAVLIAAGWKPGWSTDYIAVRLARKVGAHRLINLTNIDAVYDKDPSRYEDAEPYERLSWNELRKIVGSKWIPGANAPFDPIASKLAQSWGLEVIIAQGKNLKNVRNIFRGKPFVGTTVNGSGASE